MLGSMRAHGCAMTRQVLGRCFAGQAAQAVRKLGVDSVHVLHLRLVRQQLQPAAGCQRGGREHERLLRQGPRASHAAARPHEQRTDAACTGC